MKHKKVIDKNKFYSGHVPFASKEDKGKYAVVDDDGNWNFGSGESGSSLPEVTSADNGKVLTVANAVWTPILPSSDVVRVIFNYNYQTQALTANMTSTEVIGGLTQNKFVYAVLNTVDDEGYIMCRFMNEYETSTTYEGVTFRFNNDYIYGSNSENWQINLD